jgi:DNA-binding winged helix-turn-helix (wHTH) protein
MRFLFGDCVFEPRARRLSRAGAVVPITPKALQLLEHLLKRRPAVVSQADVRDLLWPGTFVGYSSIGHVVSELRKAMGDADHRLVRASYGAGYAFDGEVVEEAEAALPPANEATPFCLRWGTVEIPLRAGENVLGRGPECGCRIASTRVSRRHARIVVRGRSALIDDLGSKNGTHVGGRRVDGPTSLADGDVILLGQEAVLFSAAASASTTESAGP